MAKKILSRYVASLGWRMMPDDMKRELIKDVLSRGRSIARLRLMPSIAPQVAQQKAIRLDEIRKGLRGGNE